MYLVPKNTKEGSFMLQSLKRQSNIALTQNGALSFRTTQSHCLDLFATVGGLRHEPDGEIITRFTRAFAEDPDLAMKLLFFARDVRGGLGERRVFRVILKWLCESAPASVEKNIDYIAEFGRYDDLLTLLGTPCEKTALTYIKAQLEKDKASEQPSLLAKWLPSVNASNADTVANAKKVARFLGLKDADYRKLLTELRARIHIIENDLRRYDYSLDYSKQPSKAMYKYRAAFLRNDRRRYLRFLCSVSRGTAKLSTGTLTPFDIARSVMYGNVTEEMRLTADTTWNAQADCTGDENALVVADGSGSMYGEPLTVAMSLAVYFAERNRGAFKGSFITFSENPRLVEIKGGDIYEKLHYCMTFNEVANTNLQRVFELILKAAIAKNADASELPSTLYIISDMEFDCCTEDASLTNFKYAKQLFEAHGYKLPRVVFWNVHSLSVQQPVNNNEQGVMLVSGSSPRIFDMITAGDITPERYMLEVLCSERYAEISA